MILMSVCAATSVATLLALALGLLPLERDTRQLSLALVTLGKLEQELAVLKALVAAPKVDEAARRRELAERAVAYADQLGGPRAQRLAHALGAMRLLGCGAPDNIARVEIESVLARRKPPPAPGTGEKRVAP